MGAVWSAFLLGGGLAGALLIWLLRDKGKKGGAEQEDAAPGKAAAAEGDQSGAAGLSPAPSRRQPVTEPALRPPSVSRADLPGGFDIHGGREMPAWSAPRGPFPDTNFPTQEHLQESDGCLVSEPRGPASVQDAAWRQQSPGEDGDCDNSRQRVPFGRFPDTESLATSATGYSSGYLEASRNESHESHVGGWGSQKGQETLAKAAPCFVKLPSNNLPTDRGKEEVSLAHLDRQDSADQEDWEMVSRHSSWGDIGLGDSLEAPTLSPKQGMDDGRNSLVEIRGQETDVKTKRISAMTSESQQVNVRFHVHYITSTGVQFIAITGDHERLGRWKTYIPLQGSKDGFWSRSVSLPADIVVEWKFVVVENGAVTRWEECSNRFLETGHEDKLVHKCWGIQ